MKKDGKKFERVVAAIHAMEESGAQVTWNDVINGRQFDVTLRFNKAGYEFLVVIECKDYATAVPPEKIDALVTKARDAHADKAVMVAASGFQAGAKVVAERHNVTILSVKAINKSPEELANSLSPVLFLSGVRFKVDSVTPETVILSDDPRQMRSTMRHTQIIGPQINTTAANMLDAAKSEIQRVATSKNQTFAITLPKGTWMTHPNFPNHRTPIKAIFVDHVLITESDLGEVDYVSDDPRLSPEILKIEDALSGEARLVDTSQLQHGFDTVIETGHFYLNPNLGNSYYVELIDEGMVTYYVVESYVYGNLMQAKYTQNIKYSSQFVPITDQHEIDRLQLMLDKLKG